MKSFRNRLLIGVDQGNDDLEFFNTNGNILAKGYTRVVIGKRGPYIEFLEKHIIWKQFFIPPDQEYRQYNHVVFYLEYRSLDSSNVKLYFQRRRVAYADYKIGMCYISPSDLLRMDEQPIII